jgi:hypothetical protein
MGVRVFLDSDPSFFYTIKYEGGESVIYIGDPKENKKIETFDNIRDAQAWCNRRLKEFFFKKKDSKSRTK